MIDIPSFSYLSKQLLITFWTSASDDITASADMICCFVINVRGKKHGGKTVEVGQHLKCMRGVNNRCIMFEI